VPINLFAAHYSDGLTTSPQTECLTPMSFWAFSVD